MGTPGERAEPYGVTGAAVPREMVEALVDAGRPAAGALCVIGGSPGTGKSALLAAAAEHARRAGATVLAATASPAEQSLPLGILGQLLDGAAPPGLPPDARTAAFDDNWRGIRDRAARGPVLVTVDDVQYADEASARCLLYLAGRLGTSRLLVLVGGHGPARVAPPPALTELLRHPGARRITLTTLGVDATAAFLTGPGGTDPATARRLAPAWHAATGGNPRLLHALLADQAAAATPRPTRPLTGTAVRRAVSRCLRAADPAAREAARALAVVAEDATVSLVGRLLGTHDRAAAPLLDELDTMGLVASGRLRHEGIRAAVLEELSPGPCARLHERAARLLYEDGAGPATVARHLMAAHAAVGGTAAAARVPWAVPVLAEAAEQALREGDPRRAAGCLRIAHRSGRDERSAAVLLAALARAEWELDPGTVACHLTVVEQALEQGWFGQQEAAVAAGPLLWHGRLPAPGAVPAAAGGLIRQVFPGAGGAPTADSGAPERALRALALGHAPQPGITELLAALLHTTRLQRPESWCALLTEGAQDPDPGGCTRTPARRAVLAAATAVLHHRTGDHRAAARYAADALHLMPPASWGVAAGAPLAVAVEAATFREAHGEAAELLRIPVPEAMFRTVFGLHYLLARAHHQLAEGRSRAALADFDACRDLMADWRLVPGESLDLRIPAAEAPGVPGSGADPVAALSRAERRVAVLAAEGCTNRGIADRLFLTTSTVEQHLTRVYRKLGVRSRAELAALWGAPGRETGPGAANRGGTDRRARVLRG
ncbi:LuxR C-terminal-related transcriptional regulator [Streptomyces sp. NPDC057445]|uniref:helix-turn-helix transcriptional regulator n=1 Tax=Streptomyces sp. NPDC057445 TaxID=3346136 RepID=UPI0036B6E98D